MAKRRKYSEETKAQVLAALLAGQSVREAADQYKIPRGTISHWAKGRPRQMETDGDTKKRIGELLISYLEENLTTLAVQARMFRDEEWLKQAHPEQVAVLHGVLSDKAGKILEAFTDDDDSVRETGS